MSIAKTWAALAATTLSMSALAAPPTAVVEQPMRDPWVPPQVRGKALADAPVAPSSGEALRNQVEKKLKAGFDSADTQHIGLITREQADAAGLGFIVKNFDAIDRQKTGAIRFEDLKRFMKERGAMLN